ncbi:uncharacterized protein LOC141894196 [Acropora palmata]|uniref:uncharacterized protein LOC141894196 n=1 Tax=Acropora palmata TaxID=6131 RepID=UPI003DA1A94B
MEATKIVFFLLTLILVATDAKPAGRGKDAHCSKMRGRDCTRNADCACSNYQAVERLICNYNLLKCESFFETLASRIPCSRLFKKKCETDADCPCTEAPLICEERECVRKKSPVV